MADSAKVSDFQPDPQNANRGTERGQYMVDTSIEKNGAGRSILVTSDNVVIAGNKTQQAAIDTGINDAIVVDTDGSKLVIVRRTDIKSGTPKAYQMAIADNRTAEVGLEWDAYVIDTLKDGIDLSVWFLDSELETLLQDIDADPIDLDDNELNEGEIFICPKCGHEWRSNG